MHAARDATTAVALRTGTLSPVAPFDFDKALDFLVTFPPMRGEQTLTESSLTRAVSVGGRPFAFKVWATGTVEAPLLHYELYAAGDALQERLEEALLQRITNYLSIDDDLRPLYALIEEDPPFAPVMRELYGYHQVKFFTPFENACWAILSQRNLPVVALRMKRALTRELGGSIDVNGARYWPFPEAAAIAEADIAELTKILRNRRRADYIHDAACAFAGVDERFLREGPYDDVFGWLREIRGIGAWSAAFIMIRGIGRMERIAYGEKSLARLAAAIYRPGHEVDAHEMKRLADHYGNLQGYWAHYLRVAERVLLAES